MKKTIKVLLSVAFCVATMSSCSMTQPLAVTSNPVGNKVGEAKNVRVFCLIPLNPNEGINRAAKEGGITRISHVDRTFTFFYPLFITSSTRVYGE